MCSGVRRRYSAAVPEYMRDRPKDMVQKCEVRRIAGELIDVSKVKELGDGFYEVQAESSYFPHRVSLDPMCTCMDFQRHLYPCKHIYAVLSKYGKSFTDLPREYTDSPWFKLDHHVMSVSVLNDSRQSITSVCPDAGHGEYSETLVPDSNIQNENSVHQSLNPFPKKVKLTTTTANSCREMLKELSSLTYLITDITLLHGLEDKLRQTISQVKDHIETSSSGISREPETKTAGRYKPRKKQGNTRSEMKPLPKRAYPNKWTHRVGKVADCKRSRPVNIAVMSRAHQILLKAKKQSHLTSPSKTRSTESGPSQITPDYSRILDPNYCLFEDDIDPCLKLITKQWPDVVTQDCHLIQRPEMFDVVMQYGTERYAQVLHMSEKHHWVSATNIGASYGTVKYFDSLNLAIPHSTKCAIASLEKHPGKELAVAVESVQAQNGSTDCGLFAVMYLVETLFETNLRKTAFDQQKLRAHVVTCLQQNEWTRFPRLQLPSKVRRTRTHTIRDKLFCTCRRPYDNTDLDAPGGEMVLCGSCNEWFHRRCIIIKPTDLDPFTGAVDHEWQCRRCDPLG